MASFNARSRTLLESCDKRLRQLFMDVVGGFDCSVICGYRGQQEQDALFARGLSRKMYPHSKHNHKQRGPLSLAVDVAPYPINWQDKERFYYLAGFVMAIAHRQGLKIRWGGDWDGDTDLHDQTFFDLGHFELIDELVD